MKVVAIALNINDSAQIPAAVYKIKDNFIVSIEGSLSLHADPKPIYDAVKAAVNSFTVQIQ